MRYQLAWDHAVCRAVVAAFLRAVLGFLRARARDGGVADGRGAAVVIQRFGGALNFNEVWATMGFCNHCEGQRFDRAQVLRALRATRRRLRRPDAACGGADQALALVIETVRSLEVPRLEPLDELVDGEIIH